MNRLEFINQLGARLHSLPRSEASKILDYYVESIDDRMEDGMTEAEAIDSLGDLDVLAAGALSEQSRPARRRLPVWAIVLLVLGSPIWLGLGIAAAAVIGALFVSVWAVAASLWCAAFGMTLGGAAGAVMSLLTQVAPNTPAVRLLALGGSLASAGLGAMLLPCCLYLTRWLASLTRRSWRGVFHRREAMA